MGRTGGPALILYDGDCVLCSGWFRFVAQRDVDRKFLFTAIQSRYGRALAIRHGIDPDNPQSNAVLIDGDGEPEIGFRHRRDLEPAGLWLGAGVPACARSRLRDPLYSMIARNRYRWFGRNETCWLGGAKYCGLG